MPKSRLATMAYLLLVFGSGTLVGAVAHRLYVATTVTASVELPKTPAQTRQEFLGKLRTRIGANEDQVQQVNTILENAKQKYTELDAQNKPLRDKIEHERAANILSVLTPDQQSKYLQWRAEVKAEREEKARLEKARLAQTAAPRPR